MVSEPRDDREGESLSLPECCVRACVFLECVFQLYTHASATNAAHIHFFFSPTHPSRSHGLQSPKANGMGPPRLVKWRHDPCPDHRDGREVKGAGERGGGKRSQLEKMRQRR